MDSTALLQEFASCSNFSNCFQIGCFSERITLYSQQVRAFNLAWSLIDSGTVEPNDCVGVVGGGLAGMTVSLALAAKGIKVALYEKSGYLMRLQKGNKTRFLHPSVNDWPNERYEERRTYLLPYLNWNAGECDSVAKQIFEQWNAQNENIDLLLHHDVKSIVQCKSDCLQLSMADGTSSNQFRAVILSVGFGLEEPIDKVPFRSYWENDSLAQVVLSDRKKNFLVTGCGDGGCTDVLRLCLKDFDHGSFLTDLAMSYLQDHNFWRFRSIEAEAETYFDSVISQGKSFEEAHALTSLFLHKEYDGIKIPSRLEERLRLSLRPDTTVFLNSRSKSHASFKAALINRIAVHALVKMNAIHYIPGEVKSVQINQSRQFEVKIDQALYKFDEVIVRQGTKGEIQPLLGGVSAKSKKRFDITRQIHFPSKYWEGDFDSACKKVELGEDALKYTVHFLIQENVSSRKLENFFCDGFVKSLMEPAGLFFESAKTDSFEDGWELRNYNFNQVEITCGVSTPISQKQAPFDLILCLSLKNKALLDKILDVSEQPYFRFEMEPRATLLGSHNNTGFSLGDVSIVSTTIPHPAITVTRERGLWKAHKFLTIKKCVDLFDDSRFVDSGWLYKTIVGEEFQTCKLNSCFHSLWLWLTAVIAGATVIMLLIKNKWK